jgi:hypothetical protein
VPPQLAAVVAATTAVPKAINAARPRRVDGEGAAGA